MSEALNEEFLIKGARENPGRVVVVSANNEEAMEAVELALRDGVVQGGVLLGSRDPVLELARRSGVPLDRFEVIDAPDDAEAAKKAVRLIADGKGDFLLKGQVDTKIYLKAILDKEVGLVPEGNTLSHIAVMHIPTYHKPLIASDAAILIEPGVDDKARMVQNAVEFARRLGIQRPKVSMVCAVEKINPKMTSTVHADEIVKLARTGRFGNAVVEGPHDMYIATSREAGRIKKVQGEVVGDADIVCFHEINTANVFYKSIQRFVPGAWAAGLVGGARVPVLLPSRADEAQSKRMSIVIAAYVGVRSRF